MNTVSKSFLMQALSIFMELVALGVPARADTGMDQAFLGSSIISVE